MLDVIIIGGGPAGLSAALVLGRCRRSVLLIDSGRQRNRASRHLNGYLTRDGIDPREFLARGAAELARYGVEVRAGEASQADRLDRGRFRVTLSEGEELESRKLLIATGVRDIVPAIEGIDALYGSSVHHCPYCDAWEHRDKRLAAFGLGNASIGLALSLRTWSARVTACTEGGPVDEDHRTRAARARIALRHDRVVRLEGEAGALRRVHFARGDPLDCDALFFNTGQVQRSPLPRVLGCGFKEDGGVVTNDRQCTGVPGLYLAGDADRDVQFVIVAAAEGAVAATAINRELQDEDHERRSGVEPR